MPSYLSLEAVSAGVFAALQDASLSALLPGGVVGDIPEDPTYPLLWVEVMENQQFGGFGTKPGLGSLPEVEVRLHVFSAYQGGQEGQRALARAIALLADPPAVEGYAAWAIFYDRTIPIPDAELNGVKVKELVSFHRLYPEELA